MIKNKSKIAKENVSGTTFLSYNAIQNARDLSCEIIIEQYILLFEIICYNHIEIQRKHLFMTVLIISIIFIFIFIFLILIACLIGINLKKEKEINENGIESDSTVCKIEIRYKHNIQRFHYSPYVKYIGDDGNEHEARLNVSSNFPYGKKIRIKYLPGKYDYVIFVSQQIE